MSESSVDNDNNQTRIIAGATLEHIAHGNCDWQL
jgi:hypothetical protein